jgi:hypothetical protein
MVCFRDYNSNCKWHDHPSKPNTGLLGTPDDSEVRMDPKPQSQADAVPEPQPVDDALVDVFGTKDDSEAMVVQGLLDSAGIESALVSLDAPQEVLPGVGGVVIRVAAENAEAARRLIEEYRTSAEQETDEDENEDVSGPPA